MKRFNWRDLTEIFGILSIVGSLLFVGLQLNQSQEIAIAGQYQERASTAVEYYASLMHDPQTAGEKAAEIAAMVNSGSASPALQALVASRSAKSVGIWFYRHRVFFVMLDNFHYQYRSGFMAEESWNAFRRELRVQLSNDATAAYYSDHRANFRASFEELCDEILLEIKSEQD